MTNAPLDEWNSALYTFKLSKELEDIILKYIIELVGHRVLLDEVDVRCRFDSDRKS